MAWSFLFTMQIGITSNYAVNFTVQKCLGEDSIVWKILLWASVWFCLTRPMAWDTHPHPPRGNVTRQICNPTWQINEVSLGSALIFKRVGSASSSFMLKNLGKVIWSVSERLDFKNFLRLSNQAGLTAWPTLHIPPLHPPSRTSFDTALCLTSIGNFLHSYPITLCLGACMRFF